MKPAPPVTRIFNASAPNRLRLIADGTYRSAITRLEREFIPPGSNATTPSPPRGWGRPRRRRRGGARPPPRRGGEAGPPPARAPPAGRPSFLLPSTPPQPP